MPIDPVKVNRRQVLRRAAKWTVGAAAGAGFYSWQVEPYWIDVVHQTMPLAGLPAQLEGLRVVQLSDLHVSPIVSPSYLRRAIGQALDLEPDIVVLTGDLMTGEYGGQVEPAIRLLRQLDPDNRPVFATLGNHDYGRRWSDLDLASDLVGRCERIGIRTLRNETAQHDGLQIVGCDDLYSGQFDVLDALETYEPATPAICLSHNPDTVDRPGWNRFTGWILAGHTHGGQCWLPGYGAPIVPVRNKRYASGRIELDPRRTLYVNRGIGFNRQVRFLSSPEITLFTLTAKV